MKVKEVGQALAFQSDEGTIYAVTPISPIAGFLGVAGLPFGDIAKDIDDIFRLSGLTKLVMFIEEGQPDLIKLVRNLGFKQEGRLKKAYPNGDFLVFGQYR